MVAAGLESMIYPLGKNCPFRSRPITPEIDVELAAGFEVKVKPAAVAARLPRARQNEGRHCHTAVKMILVLVTLSAPCVARRAQNGRPRLLRQRAMTMPQVSAVRRPGCARIWRESG